MDLPHCPTQCGVDTSSRINDEGGAVPLTTIRSPMHEMGRQGVRLLLEVLAGRSPESVLLAPELIIRRSSMVT
jgi:DNA-binding LacI/PurR family transcriptional regulator